MKLNNHTAKEPEVGNHYVIKLNNHTANEPVHQQRIGNDTHVTVTCSDEAIKSPHSDGIAMVTGANHVTTNASTIMMMTNSRRSGSAGALL